MADKHNIPKGNIHSNCWLLTEDIICKITQRNNIRRENTCDPALKLLNAEITSDIQKHKQNIWKEHLDAHWDHMHNTHMLWKTIHGISNRAPSLTLNSSITFSNKIATTPKHIANCFPKQFINIVKHATHKTNRSINRGTQNIQGINITLTASQRASQEAIKYKQKTQHPSHPLQKHATYFNTPMLKTTIFNNGCYTTNIPTDSYTVTTTDIKTNMRRIHTYIVSMHLSTITITKYCAQIHHTLAALKRFFPA